MDHKAFLRALPIEVKAQLMLRSDPAGLRHLAGIWGLFWFAASGSAWACRFGGPCCRCRAC